MNLKIQMVERTIRRTTICLSAIKSDCIVLDQAVTIRDFHSAIFDAQTDRDFLCPCLIIIVLQWKVIA